MFFAPLCQCAITKTQLFFTLEVSITTLAGRQSRRRFGTQQSRQKMPQPIAHITILQVKAEIVKTGAAGRISPLAFAPTMR